MPEIPGAIEAKRMRQEQQAALGRATRLPKLKQSIQKEFPGMNLPFEIMEGNTFLNPFPRLRHVAIPSQGRM
jgi:hypothetical protein